MLRQVTAAQLAPVRCPGVGTPACWLLQAIPAWNVLGLCHPSSIYVGKHCSCQTPVASCQLLAVPIAGAPQCRDPGVGTVHGCRGCNQQPHSLTSLSACAKHKVQLTFVGRQTEQADQPRPGDEDDHNKIGTGGNSRPAAGRCQCSLCTQPEQPGMNDSIPLQCA